MIDYIIIGLLAVAVILLIAVLIKKGGKDNSELRIEINKEAAVEAMGQISLRNLSGIILIDFIDMKHDSSNEELMNHLSALASRDSVKTTVVDMTTLGLVEITRKKMHKPLHEVLL